MIHIYFYHTLTFSLIQNSILIFRLLYEMFYLYLILFILIFTCVKLRISNYQIYLGFLDLFSIVLTYV